MFNPNPIRCPDEQISDLCFQLSGSTSIVASSPRVLITDDIPPAPYTRLLQFDRVSDTRSMGRFDKFIPRYYTWRRDNQYPSPDICGELELSGRGCTALTMVVDADDVNLDPNKCTATKAMNDTIEAAGMVREDTFVQVYRIVCKRSARKNHSTVALASDIRNAASLFRRAPVYASVHAASSIIYAAIGDLADVVLQEIPAIGATVPPRATASDASPYDFDRPRCEAVEAALEIVGITPQPALVAQCVRNIRLAALARLATQRARIYAEAFILIEAHTAHAASAVREHASTVAAASLDRQNARGTPEDGELVLRGVTDDPGCRTPTAQYESERSLVAKLDSNAPLKYPLLTHASLCAYVESAIGEPLRLYADGYLTYSAYLAAREAVDGASPLSLVHALIVFYTCRSDIGHVLSAATSVLCVPAWQLAGRRTVALLADVFANLGLTKALTGLQEVIAVRERSPPLLFHYYQCIIRARALLARPSLLDDIGALVERNTAYIDQLAPAKKSQPASQVPWQAMQQWLLRSGSSTTAQWVLRGLLEDANVTGGVRQSNILGLFVSASVQFGDASVLDMVPAMLHADAQMGSFDREGLRERIAKGQGSEAAIALMDGVLPATDSAMLMQVADTIGAGAKGLALSPFGMYVADAHTRGALLDVKRDSRAQPVPLLSTAILWSLLRFAVDACIEPHDWRVQLILVLARRLAGTFETTVDSKLRYLGMRRELERYVGLMHDVTTDRSRSAFDVNRKWPNLFPKHLLRGMCNHAVAFLPRLQITAGYDPARAAITASLAPRVVPFGLSTLSVTGMALADANRRVAVWRDVVLDTVASSAARGASPWEPPALPPTESLASGYMESLCSDMSTHPHLSATRTVPGVAGPVTQPILPLRGPRRGLRVVGPGGVPSLRRFVRACL